YLRSALLEQLTDNVLYTIRLGPDLRTLLGRQLTEPPHDCGQPPFLATEEAHAQRLERSGIARTRDRLTGLRLEADQFFRYRCTHLICRRHGHLRTNPIPLREPRNFCPRAHLRKSGCEDGRPQSTAALLPPVTGSRRRTDIRTGVTPGDAEPRIAADVVSSGSSSPDGPARRMRLHHARPDPPAPCG